MRELSEEEKKILQQRQGFSIARALTNTIFFDYVRPVTAEAKNIFILLIPIYDVWIGSEAWGSLCGNIILLFRADNEDDQYWKSFIGDESSRNSQKEHLLLNKLRDKAQIFSMEYFKSGFHLLLSQPIAPPYDIVQHFLSNINIIQDWSRITVYRKENPQYCYSWKENKEDADESEWKQCACGMGISGQSHCEKCLKWEDTNIEKFVRWEQEIDFWSDTFMPDIIDEEKLAFHEIRFVFEYPITACIPEDKIKLKMLGEEYIRQQLEVLRGLIPKVRARRAALRNAAVSVMSRNLSHNIGSHVLAAIRNEEALLNQEEGDADFKSLFSHLQARMDFIAELSTTRTTLHFPSSLREDIVGTSEKSTANRTGMGFMAQKLLRKYISARRQDGNPVEGTVIFDGNDIIVDIAGGLLGYQALFTIFENLIRNIAKHAATLAGDRSNIKLKLRCDLDGNFPGYVQVTIWDEQGTACIEQTEKPSEDGGQYTLTDVGEQGKKPKTKMLWQVLNAEFAKVRLLDEAGAVDTNHWGLKEILICAAYLRNIALEDLEAPLPPNQPLVRVFAVGNCGTELERNATEGNLAYQIYLPVARELAVIFDEIPDDFRGKQNEALMNGVGFFTAKEILTPLPHRLVAWLAKVEPDLKVWEKMRGRLSPRFVNLPTENAKDGLLSLLRSNEFEKAVEHIRQASLKKDLEKFGEGEGSIGTVYSFNFTNDPLNKLSSNGAISSCTPELLTELSNKMNITINESLLQKSVILDSHFGIKDSDLFPVKKGLVRRGRFLDFLRIGGGYEVFPTISKQRALLSTWERSLSKKSLSNYSIQRECLRGFVSGVLILDERVQEAVYKVPLAEHPFLARGLFSMNRDQFMKNFPGDSSYLSFPAMLAASNIWVPSPNDIDLYNPSGKLDEFISRLTLTEIEAPGGQAGGRKLDFKRIAYLVIHQGVIDRLRRDGKDDSLIDFFTKLTVNTTLIVCSGRGRPAELAWVHEQRHDVRFVPVSTLLDLAVNHPSKMHLVMSLDASRCPL